MAIWKILKKAYVVQSEQVHRLILGKIMSASESKITPSPSIIILRKMDNLREKLDLWIFK